MPLPTPNLDAVFTKVRAFVLAVAPSGTPVLRGPLNRVPQPTVDHVIITPLFHKRLRTNVHTDDPLNDLQSVEQGTQVHIQADCYGSSSGDLSQALSTLWRDEFGVSVLSPEAVPLYTDTARMVPLVTGEEQFLERFTLTLILQWNPAIVIAQEYADAAEATLIEVDTRFPPT